MQGCGPSQLLFEQQCLYLHGSAELSHRPLLNQWQSSLELPALMNVFLLAAKVVGSDGFAAASAKRRKLLCVAICPDNPQRK